MKPDLWERREQTFAGFPILQSRADLAMWELFLNTHEPDNIIEIGTYGGGMAYFLALQAKAREMGFMTLDDKLRPGVRRLRELANNADIITASFTDTSTKLWGFLRYKKRGSVVLFCDNGNKPKEVATLLPLLKKGDFLSVHDWNDEIGPEDMAPFVYRLTPVLDREAEVVGSWTRWWWVKE